MEPMIGRPRRRSLVGPLILIFVGLMFLAFNFVPGFDPWPVLARYWPLILILMGLGRLWDYYRAGQRQPDEPRPAVCGSAVALVLLFVLLVAGSWHGRKRYGRLGHFGDRGGVGNFGDFGHRGFGRQEAQDTKAVELGGAKTVSASIEMPSGMLMIAGADSTSGARLMDGEFRYEQQEDRPTVDYQVSGDHGQLEIGPQDTGGNHTRVVGVGGGDSEWNLHFAKGIPIELKIEMGAGQSDLNLKGVNVSELNMDLGAGELNLDLTGDRKNSLKANIEGGAGTATIRLPKEVGVRVMASGGIGSIQAPGLQRDGDIYTNETYGKTAASIDMTVEGGVGTIRLSTE